MVARARGVNIYEQGSGNPGTANILRTLGTRAAAVVLVGDATKGALAAALGSLWISETVGFACAFAAVLGHVFPLWHRFRGGKGVATAIGGAIWLEPIVGLVLAALWVLIVLRWKTASIASLLAMVLYVPGFVITGHDLVQLLWASAIAVVVIVRHAPNIRSLLAGEERSVRPG